MFEGPPSAVARGIADLYRIWVTGVKPRLGKEARHPIVGLETPYGVEENVVVSAAATRIASGVSEVTSIAELHTGYFTDHNLPRRLSGLSKSFAYISVDLSAAASRAIQLKAFRLLSKVVSSAKHGMLLLRNANRYDDRGIQVIRSIVEEGVLRFSAYGAGKDVEIPENFMVILSFNPHDPVRRELPGDVWKRIVWFRVKPGTPEDYWEIATSIYGPYGWDPMTYLFLSLRCPNCLRVVECNREGLGLQRFLSYAKWLNIAVTLIQTRYSLAGSRKGYGVSPLDIELSMARRIGEKPGSLLQELMDEVAEYVEGSWGREFASFYKPSLHGVPQPEKLTDPDYVGELVRKLASGEPEAEAAGKIAYTVYLSGLVHGRVLSNIFRSRAMRRSEGGRMSEEEAKAARTLNRIVSEDEKVARPLFHAFTTGVCAEGGPAALEMLLESVKYVGEAENVWKEWKNYIEAVRGACSVKVNIPPTRLQLTHAIALEPLCAPWLTPQLARD